MKLLLKSDTKCQTNQPLQTYDKKYYFIGFIDLIKFGIFSNLFRDNAAIHP
jgi:hypothetical protein